MIEHALFHKISIHIIKYQKLNNSNIHLLNLKNIRMCKMHICPSTTQDEATLNSEEIKPVTIAIIELRLSEGIS